jgi:hypothetical protein
MDIVDMAIPRVVCQKSDFNRNSDFQNFQKPDPLQITAKKLSQKNDNFSKIFWCKKLTIGVLQKYNKIYLCY